MLWISMAFASNPMSLDSTHEIVSKGLVIRLANQPVTGKPEADEAQAYNVVLDVIQNGSPTTMSIMWTVGGGAAATWLGDLAISVHSLDPDLNPSITAHRALHTKNAKTRVERIQPGVPLDLGRDRTITIHDGHSPSVEFRHSGIAEPQDFVWSQAQWDWQDKRIEVSTLQNGLLEYRIQDAVRQPLVLVVRPRR